VLERGRLQQLATPQELYARPANRFVAGFIGSPPMNFLPARLLPAAHAADGVVAGVRPESVSVVAADAADALAATVESVELLGHETLVHVRLGAADVRWVTREPGSTRLRPGERVGLRVSAAATHLFAEDGRALR
jgi:ABC-type sugar transport system ATPase subunit